MRIEIKADFANIQSLSRISYDDKGLNVILENIDTKEVLEQITNEEGFKNFGYVLDTKEDFMNLLEELGFETYEDFNYCMRHSKSTDSIRP